MSASKKQRKSPAEVAASYGLSEEEVGPIDGARFVDFPWQMAGRPLVHPSDWKRERPLYVVLDNYSVHRGDAVKAAQEALEAGDIRRWYLPSYTPELSAIEPLWNALKHHEMQVRSHTAPRSARTGRQCRVGRPVVVRRELCPLSTSRIQCTVQRSAFCGESPRCSTGNSVATSRLHCACVSPDAPKSSRLPTTAGLRAG